MNNIQPKIDWIGDLKVSTSVSWRSMLKMIGKIFPGGERWFERLNLELDGY